jgi:hypothetical protein
MNRFFTILYLFCILQLPVLAQAPEDSGRCGTSKHYAREKESDPSRLFRMNSIEKNIRQWMIDHPADAMKGKDIITIPAVVHVVYNTPEQNIPDEQIYSQFWVLNEDYRRLNPDSIFTPVMFRPVAEDCGFEFCMAQRTPQNTMTNGIERVHTDSTEFGLNDWVKSTYTGGAKAWDSHKYLNIWVCKLSANVLGYSQYPGGNDSTDGVVIDYRVFGKTGANLNPHYNLGRTSTHEIGHWLLLFHPWGEGESNPGCTESDSVSDTPVCSGPNYYCPAHPHVTNCNSTGEMFMNYMDYVDDVCFNLFTKGQSARMHAVMNLYRAGILTSDGCDTATGISSLNRFNHITVSPNPAIGLFHIKGTLHDAENISIMITDLLGKVVETRALEQACQLDFYVDLTSRPKGMYFLRMRSGSGSWAGKLILQ